MAGSGLPPLPNIPYCCLPQESGPCLSSSVGDRPLRSPSHRRLGGPSPRLPANGTHARPLPTCLCPTGDAPGRDHAALPAVSSGCAAGGGWLHTRYAPVRHSHSPEGELPSDLHVLGLPLAFILSQDQTLRCTIVVLLFSSGSMVPPSLLSLFLKVPYPASPNASRRLLGYASCAGLKLSKNFRNPSPRPGPSSLDCGLQKYNLSQYRQ